MNWRNVVCVLAAGVLCTGALLPGDRPLPGPTAVENQPRALTAGQYVPNQPVTVQTAGTRNENAELSPTAPLPVPGHPHGADRLCADTAYFSNLVQSGNYYFPEGAGIEVADDCRAMAPFNMTCYTFWALCPSAQNITVQCYTACPYGSGQLIPGTTCTLAVPAGDSAQHDFILPNPVAMPASFWVGFEFSGDGGPILCGPATIGTDENVMGIEGQGCNWWFGGFPWAGWGFAAYGPVVPYACCLGGVCIGDMGLLDCWNAMGVWYQGETCANFQCVPPPPEDECVNVPAPNLPPDTTLTFIGDNTGATVGNDCVAFGQFPNVWVGFTTTECFDITIDYCATAPAFGKCWLNLAIGCNPNCSFAAATMYDSTTCGDGNVTIKWYGLPAATYYYPVLMSQQYAAVGWWVVNVIGHQCAAGSAVTGFEPPDYTGSPGGTILTGQRGWYQPVATGTDCKVYTYAGNTYGIAQNPEGGEQFIGGRMEGSALMARAEHAFSWADQDVWKVMVDVATLYTGTLPAVDNLASMSLQPSATSKYWQHIMTWQDVNTATQFRSGYLTAENPAAPGVFPGPGWQNLPVNHWYRLSTTFRFSDNLILEVGIKDLTTGQETVVQPTGWHLLQGTLPVPTALRFYTGGGGGTSPAGNFAAWDNVSIAPAVTILRGDCNCSGTVDAFDIDPFVLGLTNFAGWQAAYPGCPWQNLDCDCNGAVNAFDIDPFVLCLTSGCPCK